MCVCAHAPTHAQERERERQKETEKETLSVVSQEQNLVLI